MYGIQYDCKMFPVEERIDSSNGLDTMLQFMDAILHCNKHMKLTHVFLDDICQY